MSIPRKECDISKTHAIFELLQTPKDKRDKNWKSAFFENIKTASFRCGNPQVFPGPDKFPYFALHLPEENVAFESFCISNLKDDYLLKEGIGVVINPSEKGADWVFTYGDLVNFHLRNEFYSNEFDVEIEYEVKLKNEEKVLIAQPSEKFLPNETRKIIKEYLLQIGIATPKMMLVTREIENQMIPELAFNIYAEDYQNKDELKYYMHRLSWYLPRHYIILSVPKGSDLAKGFLEL